MRCQQFIQPADHSQLVAALGKMKENCYLVAGGTDFLAQRNGHYWQAETIVSLAAAEELRQIRLEGDSLVIGACCTHSSIADNPLVQQYFPALAQACSDVGSVQIRNRGTIGGNLANASPAGDTIPCLFLLETKTELLNGADQRRLLPVDEFLLGPGKTAMARGEMLYALHLPLPKPGWQNVFLKLGTRSKVTISQIILTATWQKSSAGNVEDILLYIGSISNKPVLVENAKALLCGKKLDGSLLEPLTGELAGIIARLTPVQFDRDYKRLAVKGLADDLLGVLRPSAY